MISDELTSLMMQAQQVAMKFETVLNEQNAGDADVSAVDYPASFVGLNPDRGIGVTPLEKYMADKDKLAHVLIPAAIRTHNFQKCVLTFTAWVLENPDDLDTPPSEHPDRKEIYFIAGFENGTNVMTWASVDRSTDVPKLVNWKPVTESDTFLGRFAEPIQETLKEVANESA